MSNHYARDWCILRCAPRHTLRLAETIAKAGIEAWAPSEVSRPRVPGRRARITLRDPILPRFVFADAARLLDLLALSHKPLAGFSLLSDGNHRYAVCADRALTPLRDEEAKRERKRLHNLQKQAKGKPLRLGQRVEMPKGAWEGLSGIVDRSDASKTRIDLGKFYVEVSTWLLANDGLDIEQAAA